MNHYVWISALVLSVCVNAVFILTGLTRPASAYAGARPAEQAAADERLDAVQSLMRLSTEQQQQIYALRLAVEQIGSESVSAGPNSDPGVAFATIGALIRSVPQEVILDKYDTDLTDVASGRWMERNTRGRTVRADLVIDKLDLDRQTGEIQLKATPFIEPYGTTHVEATVVCTFASEELDRMAYLREGMRVRVQGVIDQAFFVRPGQAEGHALKVYIQYTRVIDGPVAVVGTP